MNNSYHDQQQHNKNVDAKLNLIAGILIDLEDKFEAGDEKRDLDQKKQDILATVVAKNSQRMDKVESRVERNELLVDQHSITQNKKDAAANRDYGVVISNNHNYDLTDWAMGANTVLRYLKDKTLYSCSIDNCTKRSCFFGATVHNTQMISGDILLSNDGKISYKWISNDRSIILSKYFVSKTYSNESHWQSQRQACVDNCGENQFFYAMIWVGNKWKIYGPHTANNLPGAQFTVPIWFVVNKQLQMYSNNDSKRLKQPEGANKWKTPANYYPSLSSNNSSRASNPDSSDRFNVDNIINNFDGRGRVRTNTNNRRGMRENLYIAHHLPNGIPDIFGRQQTQQTHASVGGIASNNNNGYYGQHSGVHATYNSYNTSQPYPNSGVHNSYNPYDSYNSYNSSQPYQQSNNFRNTNNHYQ